MTLGQLHHIEYYVKNLEASNAFWGWFLPVMGYEKYQSWERGVSWRQGSGLNHIAFQGGDNAQLDHLHAELLLRNIQVLKKKHNYLCLQDPNDFAVEIFFS